ncbi:MAG: hypothetical protein R3C01_16630 [Planctomycetaceae bacterium]
MKWHVDHGGEGASRQLRLRNRCAERYWGEGRDEGGHRGGSINRFAMWMRQ